MPPRRVRYLFDYLDLDVRLVARWEIEVTIVRYAVLLLVHVDGSWRPVELFDCSHGERNDRHRYDRAGGKGLAESFHAGSPNEALPDAIDLIRTEWERMIERWDR